jgi:hypothetical protein
VQPYSDITIITTATAVSAVIGTLPLISITYFHPARASQAFCRRRPQQSVKLNQQPEKSIFEDDDAHMVDFQHLGARRDLAAAKSSCA